MVTLYLNALLRHNPLRLLSGHVIFFLSMLCGNTQATPILPEQVKFQSILESDLEKIGYINDIIEDKQGFIWIGAIRGLARYNGYELKVYSHDTDTPGSLTHPWVKNLLVDDQQRLWVVTYNGLCQYSPNTDNFNCATKEEPGTQPELVSFYHMFQDQNGNMWVSSSMGLLFFNPDTHTFNPAPEKIAQHLSPIANSEANFVNTMAQHPDGTLWIALEGNGLVSYHPTNHEIRHYKHNPSNPGSLPNNKVRGILIDSKERVWVGSTGGGLSLFNPLTGEFTAYVQSANEKADTVWDMLEDPEGFFWVGDGTGVHLFDPQTGAFDGYQYSENNPDGPGNFVTRTLYRDSTGGMWAGYYPSGVDLVDRDTSHFVNYRYDENDPHSLPDGGVLATLETPEGNLWVGCGFGLGFFDRQKREFTRFAHDPKNTNSLSGSTVLDMARAKDGSLWIGAWDRGLNHFNPNTNQFTRYQASPENPQSLFGREPWSVMLDQKGQLWVGTEKGVNFFHAEDQIFEKVMPLDDQGNPVENLYTRHIFQDTRGRLWVSTFNGLYQLDPNTRQYKRHFRHNVSDPNSLSWDQVLVTYEDAQGRLWVGTNGGGLNLFNEDSSTFTRFGLSHGLPDLNISGIVSDLQGHIWVSTYQGLARLNPDTLEFDIFDKTKGLIGNLFNRNSPSRLKTGELVFGSTRGLTFFQPAKIKPNPHAPQVVLSEFSIFNQPQSSSGDSVLTQSILTADRIKLTHKESVFSFKYTALNYRTPSENQYAYRLLGFESNWNFVGARRLATYTNLDPGEYTFQVKAANNSGVWNNSPRSIIVVISPPWWKTPLAYFVYTLIIVLLITQIVRAQKKKFAYEREKLNEERALVKKLQEIDRMKDELNQQLDQKVAERTQELHQEHSRLLQAQKELQALNRKLEEVSVTDPLTGLKNRRFLFQTIENDIARTDRWYKDHATDTTHDSPTDITFILVDVDHFKQVNDQFGHNAGDALLRQLSALLQDNIRVSDYVVRWGGEEFIIVIRHLSREETPTLLQRLEQEVNQHSFSLPDGAPLTRTISIGAASYPFLVDNHAHVTWEQVINIADRALYAAKSSGRNRWVYLQSKGNISDPTNLIMEIETSAIKHHLESGALTAKSSRTSPPLCWDK